MARFLSWSDLHIEFENFEIPGPEDLDGPIDAVLIAGDTDGGGRHVDFMARVWDRLRVPVLAVGGNHEPWGSIFQDHLAEEQEKVNAFRSAGADIEVMRRSERVIAGTRVIGATLWTDLSLHSTMAMFSHIQVAKVVKDYRHTRWRDGSTVRKMTPADSVGMHKEDMAYILSRLDENFDGYTLAMTHHLPISQMRSPRRTRIDSVEDCAYASDLWHKIGEYDLDAWFCGHSHDADEVVLEGRFGEVCFLNNSRGYPNETTRFNRLRIIESSAPRIGSSLENIEKAEILEP